MLLELSIPHVMAPVLGNSINVWSTMIMMSVGGLAIGYFLGAKIISSQKPNNPIHFIFGINILILSLCILLITIQNWIGLGMNPINSAYFIAFLSLLIPCVFFGALPPVLISMGKSIGPKMIGEVFFYSTIGGVIFTLFTGYFLIPQMGLLLTISVGILLLMYGLYKTDKLIAFLGIKKWGILSFALLCILISNTYQVTPSEKVEIIHFSEGLNGQVLVAETDQEKILFINRMGQTRVYKANGSSVWTYPYFIKSLASILPKGSNSLVLGLGGGIVPMELESPDIGHFVTAVEIDSKIIEVANEHFGLENSNVEVFEDDGRRFINKSQKKYDLIVLDVFNGEIAPSHVLSKEAFLQLRKILSANGFVIVNFNGFLFGQEGVSTRSLIKTIRSAGLDLKICPTLEEGESQRNNIVIAYEKEPDWSSAKQPIMYNGKSCRVGIEFRFFEESKLKNLSSFIVTDDKPLMEDLNKFAAMKWREEYLKNYTLKYRDDWSVPLIK